jgi:ParB-like chromosome segregation protein Spo0J
LADKFGYTQDAIAKKISKSRSTVTELMTIAGLPADVRERCKRLDLNAKSALLEVARQFDEAAMGSYLEGLENGTERAKTADRAQPLKKKEASTSKPGRKYSYAPDGQGYSLVISFDGDADDERIIKALDDARENLTARRQAAG